MEDDDTLSVEAWTLAGDLAPLAVSPVWPAGPAHLRLTLAQHYLYGLLRAAQTLDAAADLNGITVTIGALAEIAAGHAQALVSYERMLPDDPKRARWLAERLRGVLRILEGRG